MKFMVEDLPNQKWTPLTANGGFDTLQNAPFYLRSDGHLVIIVNRRKLSQIHVAANEGGSLAVGSIEDANISKYDKFNIKSTAHRLPFIGGGRANNAGVTIKVMDKKAQEEQEKKEQEETQKRQEKREQREKEIEQEMKESGTSIKKRDNKLKSKPVQDIAVGRSDSPIEEAVSGQAPDLDFLGAFSDDDY